MIVMQLQGGLGSQMFQYALGRSLAHDRRTELVLDVDYCAMTPQNDFEGYCLNQAFGIQAPVLSGWRRLRVAAWHSMPWLRRSRTFHHKKIRFGWAIFDIGANCYVSGPFNDIRYWDHNAHLVRGDFASLSDCPVDLSWAKQIEETTSVAVHVRRGDYLGAASLKVQGLDYYLEAMARAESFLGDSEPTYFIFSDEPDWVEQNFPRDRRIRVVESSTRSSWQEMALMSRCDHFIIANSTFSFWAAYLGSSHDSFVAYPFEWKTKEKLNHLFVEAMPSGWSVVGRPANQTPAGEVGQTP